MGIEDDNLVFDFSEDEEDNHPHLEPEESPEIAPPSAMDEDEVVLDDAPEHRPLWAVIILAIWIIAFYFVFYYFLIGHRFEKFAVGG
jgi:hypothetical protein